MSAYQEKGNGGGASSFYGVAIWTLCTLYNMHKRQAVSIMLTLALGKHLHRQCANANQEPINRIGVIIALNSFCAGFDLYFLLSVLCYIYMKWFLNSSFILYLSIQSSLYNLPHLLIHTSTFSVLSI